MTIRKGVEAELSLHISVKEPARATRLPFRQSKGFIASEGYMTINGSSAPYEDSALPRKRETRLILPER